MPEEWESIGMTSPVGANTDNVPAWVLTELSKLEADGSLYGALENNHTLILRGNTFEYQLAPAGQAAGYVNIARRKRSNPSDNAKHKDGLRRRATCVVVKNGKVLLVRDKGRRQYSLPGGGIKQGEPSISAAARELYEETGLRADKMERVLTHEGNTQSHAVFLISEHRGEPRLISEIDSLIWWDQDSTVSVQDHVRTIVGQLEL
ncbi:hypothetical protein LCGC14_2649980 [marine sediment metagenome]|uniref:Nudix hydrolase domain-containing protein n=1 Tax=marine sediment metagenome TaxID=412755 RepID=A0A0F8ZV21_9ZZZZ